MDSNYNIKICENDAKNGINAFTKNTVAAGHITISNAIGVQKYIEAL